MVVAAIVVACLQATAAAKDGVGHDGVDGAPTSWTASFFTWPWSDVGELWTWSWRGSAEPEERDFGSDGARARRSLQQCANEQNLSLPPTCANCVPPRGLDPCRYDIRDCEGRPPGGVCNVFCRSPYDGGATRGMCPVGNSDPTREVNYVLPNCSFDDCTEPDPILEKMPTGYDKRPDGWHCARGFGGRVVQECLATGAVCETQQAVFSGCDVIVPCAPIIAVPELERCKFDVKGCGSLEAGTSCSVACRWPYVGKATNGTCPADNVDPSHQPVSFWPTCECSDPADIPKGYVKQDGAWACDDGYSGRAFHRCLIGADCFVQSLLTGCEKMVPCRGGVNASVRSSSRFAGCELNFTGCEEVLPGEACKVGCKVPTYALAILADATCPIDNTRMDGTLELPIYPECEPQCTDPDPFPAGYAKDGYLTKCARGYIGDAVRWCDVLANCSLRATFSGCLEMKPCTPLPATRTRCELDAPPTCSSLMPAQSCEVGCKAPFVGGTTTATCPDENTDENRQPVLAQNLQCELQCPNTVPVGYEMTPAGLRCGLGFNGTAQKICDVCGGPATLSGCMPLQKCADPLVLDLCRHELVGCTSLSPGASCKVECRHPYVGPPTFLTCPADNVDASEGPIGIFPDCNLTCPDPDPMPDGYMKTGPDTWDCTPDYKRTPGVDAVCDIDNDCVSRRNLTGCTKLRQCLAPKEQAHWVDTSGCTSLLPGNDCEVRCIWPYVGTTAIAKCPAGNTDPLRELVGRFPECTLSCDFVPPGYMKLPSGWECIDGYAGNVSITCENTTGYARLPGFSTCSSELTFHGCNKIIPCKAPKVDLCRYDVSDCATFANGSSCSVTCRAPYANAAASILHCPAQNTDTDSGLVGALPECVIPSCPDPVVAPEGYALVGGGWECNSTTHVGEALKLCTTDAFPACKVIGVLAGCAEVTSCAPYDDQSHDCRFEAMDCGRDLSMGEQCTLRCRPPLLASVRSAPSTCFARAAGTQTPLDLRFPQCACPEPAEAPPGYTRLAVEGPDNFTINGSWVCAAGYNGTAVEHCEWSCANPGCGGCTAEMQLSGCAEIVPCVLPPLPSRCDMYNFSDCSFQSGTFCELTCLEPFVGNASGTATCPAENTKSSRPLDVELPHCTLQCTDPDPPPVGFVADGGENGWRCRDGFRGNATRRCYLDENCSATVELSGCEEVLPCEPPALDACRFNASTCESLRAGDTCEIECVSPYVGQGTTATCPTDKVPSSTELHLTLPRCALDCTDPDYMFPNLTEDLGYRYNSTSDEWACADNYTGNLSATCSINQECKTSFNLTGCDRLHPCLPFVVEECFLDASDCTSSERGASCEVRCQWPYAGGSSTARCPQLNTDPAQRMVVQAFECECPMPDPVPEGYERVAETGLWQCAPGYAASAEDFVADCIFNCTDEGPASSAPANISCEPNCKAFWRLEGCQPYLPCETPTSPDECMTDISHCIGLKPGATCEIPCLSPYVGDPGSGHCPPTDEVISQSLDVSFPECVLTCPDPRPEPDGYRKDTDEEDTEPAWDLAPWICDERSKPGAPYGFTGTVLKECSISPAPDCLPSTTLLGCSAKQSCLPQDVRSVDICQFNVSGCGVLAPGDSCPITCKLPYLGSPGVATCPPLNTNPIQMGLWNPAPSCDLDCPEVTNMPVGYRKVDGRWQCDDGWIGGVSLSIYDARASCIMHRVYRGGSTVDCEIELFMTGCVPLQPCALPTVEPCKYDMSACSAVWPNTTCEITCMFPFVGPSPGSGFCQENNIDPLTPLLLNMPMCEPTCEDPYAAHPYWERYEPFPNTTINVGKNVRWQCKLRYTGIVEQDCAVSNTCGTTLLLAGCVPEQQCTPLSVKDASACEVDTSQCQGLWPGETCPVSCVFPCLGKEATALCPVGNTQRGRNLEVAFSRCEYSCDSLPPGYMKTEEGWKCAPGYVGFVYGGCGQGLMCSSELTLTGCLPVQPCGPPSRTVANRCTYDVSDCVNVPPGKSCMVHCKWPFGGNDPTIAYCPWNNTKYLAPVEWKRHTCTIQECSDPKTMPDGYAAEGDGWSCVGEYTGEVRRVCVLGSKCKTYPVFSGCIRSITCMGPRTGDMWGDFHPCRYNVTVCGERVPAATTCEVPCMYPFEGTATSATCPSGNYNPYTRVSWTPAACQSACPVTYPFQEGYSIVDSTSITNASDSGLIDLEALRLLALENGWECTDATHAGNATERCSFDGDCNPTLILSGCRKREACTSPPADFDQCRYDVTDCESVEPGGTCELRCRLPYRGVPTQASCPFDNIAANRTVDYLWPNCNLTERCLTVDPVPVPQGYIKTRFDDYVCALHEWIGVANRTCTLSPWPDCAVSAHMSGCGRPQFCAAPDLRSLDPCTYNISGCNEVVPGGTCLFGCMPPYVGNATNATCPYPNTDPYRPLEFTFPTCKMECPDPAVAPTGYVWSHKADGTRAWKCEVGYWAAKVEKTCYTGGMLQPWEGTTPRPGGPVGYVDCVVLSQLSGCLPLTACAPLTPSADDSCRLDTSGCSGVWAGLSCTVICNEPRATGTAGVARCPANNTDPNGQLVWEVLPACSIPCVEPNPLPLGYVGGVSDPSCAEGFVGSSSVEEVIDGLCDCGYAFSGCERLVPCTVSMLDPCMMNASGCVAEGNGSHGLGPGESCTVHCVDPYVGEPGTASCPENNTLPLRPVDFLPPACRLVCREPDELPRGYELDPSASISPQDTEDPSWKWRCADGFMGYPNLTCSVNATCGLQNVLSGCLELSSCVAPSAVEACQFDASECVAVRPGGSCHVHCRPPAHGTPMTLSCPTFNTDPSAPLRSAVDGGVAVLPDCEVTECYDGLDIGYARTHAGWACAQGYGGEPRASCVANEWCRPSPRFTGCATSMPCAALVSPDPCRYDVSSCGNVPPGGVCEVRCKPPYVGSPVNASCSVNNTDPLGEMRWTPPFCYLPGCPDPALPPIGFTRVAPGVWQCAEDYSGVAVKDCSVAPDCTLMEAQLSGCRGLAPCVAPSYTGMDRCRIDVSLCEGALFGTTCPLRCKAPYVGEPTVAGCPEENTDRRTVVQHTKPYCVLECPDPDEASLGYRRADGGGWECDVGYVGRVRKACVVSPDDCSVEVALRGCTPQATCADLTTDDCAFDVSSCAGVLAGGSCEVRCRPPFVGASVLAQCPEDNVDASGVIEWTPPECVCANPIPAPHGYELYQDVWACGSGFVGQPVLSCRKAGTCLEAPLLEGCALPRPCGILPFVDISKARGVVSGVVSFGPAFKRGDALYSMDVDVMVEGSVLEYLIYFADACGRPMGSSILKVAKKEPLLGTTPLPCCNPSHYSVLLENEPVPRGSSQIVVVVRTRFGPAGEGLSVPFIDDFVLDNVTSKPRLVPLDNLAPRRRHGCYGGWHLWMVYLVVLARMTPRG